MNNDSDRTLTLKSSVDLSIVGDNILDIANFAIEKHEFRNDTTLSSGDREAAIKQVAEALWEIIEDLRLRRKQILRKMFDRADEVVKEYADAS